jgi:4-aminobutyrate aminotransferase-like enzyme
MVVLDHGYHGNTSGTIDLSPHKFNGPGGRGRPDWVHVAPIPDPYRSEFTGSGASERFGAEMRRIVAQAAAAGQPVAGLLAEAIPSVAGQVVPEPGVLAAAYAAVREAGGVCIADEVQTGFGRVGSAWWAFELMGVVPDIVTMGKPIGNGHPMGAVVTTRPIATAFDNGMEYFNTFGGNPVSGAVGLAVLDVMERESLRDHAAAVGAHLRARLTQLAARHDTVGDVRGAGLFLGVELVRDRAARTPDAGLAATIVEHARSSGVLLSTDGPHHNVIKIKPPLPFSIDDADRLVAAMAEALAAVPE